MKKIALFSLMIALFGVYSAPTFAANVCGAGVLTIRGNQDPYDDEFLFTSLADFQRAVEDYAHKDEKGNYDRRSSFEHSDWGSDKSPIYHSKGRIFECDNTACNIEVYAIFEGTAYRGNSKNDKNSYTSGSAFRCSYEGANDFWKPVELEGDCAEGARLNRIKMVSGSDYLSPTKYSAVYFKRYNGGVCKCTGTKEYQETPGAQYYTGICKTKAAAAATPGQCSFVGEILSGPRLCSTYDKNMSSDAAARTGKECTNVCLKSQSGSFVQQIAIHNCEQGKIENRTFPDSVLNVFNAESQSKLKGYIYRCDDKAATEKPKTEKPKTEKPKKEKPKKEKPDGEPDVTPTPTPAPTPVEEEKCYYTLNMDIKCNNGHSFSKGYVVELSKAQADKIGGCEAAKVKMGSLEEEIKTAQREIKALDVLMEAVCGESSAAVLPIGPSSSALNDAVNRMESFTKTVESKKSVWKDADGNFNTARLASDLTAGVVLGTVGGVVSGVVIKKKQVEKGFDALHCTVGGQKIADWGDTFSVGLQK